MGCTRHACSCLVLEYRRVVIETDCLEVVKILKRTSQVLSCSLGTNCAEEQHGFFSSSSTSVALVDDEKDRNLVDSMDVQEWSAAVNMNMVSFKLREDLDG
ncbi:hypothetical protein V6N13_147771 [Hibiscus sabdariffa]